MRSVVQFGAGSIGRGFMAHLFCEAGFEVVFVDVEPQLVAGLNRRGRYPLRLVGPERFETIEIGPVRAVDARDGAAVAAELAAADLACTAVGVAVLPRLAPVLAQGLARRAERGDAPLNVLLCENQLRCSDLLRGLVEKALPAAPTALLPRLGLVETVVARMVPVLPPGERAADPLLVVAEDYHHLPVDRSGSVGPLPDIPGIEPVDHLLPWAERKLYTHNMGHAAAAYLGHRFGCARIDQAMAAPAVAAAVEGAMAEVGEALCRKHGFERPAMRAYVADLRRRFRNAALGDTVARVGRDPLRKLGPHDRLVGALWLCLDQGVEPRQVLAAIAAALAYDAPEDPGAVTLQARLAGEGLDAVLAEVCGLPPDGEAAGMIRAARERLQAA
jgi:mannitol-1-phosphate 5-dehydrogenase